MNPRRLAPVACGRTTRAAESQSRPLVACLVWLLAVSLAACDSRGQAAEVERTQLQTTPKLTAASTASEPIGPSAEEQSSSAPQPSDEKPLGQPQVQVAGEVPAQQEVHLAQPADAGALVLSKEVEVVFKTVPPVWASVRMGSKKLGTIKGREPLVLKRPRDSGPLDVVIRAEGYLPVHTRAYTFDNSEVDVKMTKVEEKHTLYGFKEPLPPVDAGVPTL